MKELKLGQRFLLNDIVGTIDKFLDHDTVLVKLDEPRQKTEYGYKVVETVNYEIYPYHVLLQAETEKDSLMEALKKEKEDLKSYPKRRQQIDTWEAETLKNIAELKAEIAKLN